MTDTIDQLARQALYDYILAECGHEAANAREDGIMSGREDQSDFIAGYLRGAIAMRDRCAAIAEDVVSSVDQARQFGFMPKELLCKETAKKIAAAIRSQGE